MIPITKPWLGERELAALRRPIESGWVAQGPEVEAFEQEIIDFTGAKHACAVSSGTVALELALQAIGVTPADEVITVSHSFIATANAIRRRGAVPVFADIDAETYCIDPSLIEALVGPKTRAIVVVHQLGMPCDLNEIVELASRHELPLVEDAACALGSEIRIGAEWERIGRPHGDVACFSFHPRKIVTTGEGGLIATNDEAIDGRCRSLRQHGMSPRSDRQSFSEVATNARMSDLHASVGRVQLEKLEAIVARRREQAARYREQLVSVDGVTPPSEPAWARSNWQSYCVRLDEEVDQAGVIEEMRSRGVATLPGLMCAHRAPVYTIEPWKCGKNKGKCGCAPGHCRRLLQSELAEDHGLVLPLYHELSESEQGTVVEALNESIQRSRKR